MAAARAKQTRTGGVSKAAADQLAALAVAFSRFAEWLMLAGVRGESGKHWRVFPAGEIRGRFTPVEVACSRAEVALPPAARQLIQHAISGIRSSVRDEGSDLSLGVAFLGDIHRTSELLKFYCRADLGLRGPEFMSAGSCGCGAPGEAACEQ